MADLTTPASTSLSTSTPSVNSSTATQSNLVNIGTRKSNLARIQTDIVVDLFKKSWPAMECEIHAISTMGDKNQVTALHDFGAKNLWTFELEDMLRKHEIDLIVHSLKDIPTQMSSDLTIGAITPRGDPRDALVLHPSLPGSTTMSSLPENSTIGTSSVRRSAQLKRLYPHLRFQSVRGNVNTRLRKLDESILEESKDSGAKQGESHTVEEDASSGKPQYSALILAAAGLIRLELGHRISRYLSSKNLEDVCGPDGAKSQRKGMLHAVGQGALGVQIREGDQRVVDLLAPLQCRKTSLAAYSERSLMRTLEGGCSVPIGVETEWAETSTFDAESTLTMRAIVVSLDGLESVEEEASCIIKTNEQADQFGRDVAKMLVDKGAMKILKKINLNRDIIEKQGDA